jgi:hypothetical protein
MFMQKRAIRGMKLILIASSLWLGVLSADAWMGKYEER